MLQDKSVLKVKSFKKDQRQQQKKKRIITILDKIEFKVKYTSCKKGYFILINMYKS